MTSACESGVGVSRNVRAYPNPVGIKHGYFADENLDIQLTPIQSTNGVEDLETLQAFFLERGFLEYDELIEHPC